MNNIIQLAKPCTLCESKDNVHFFKGLQVCDACEKNIKRANFGFLSANDEEEIVKE